MRLQVMADGTNVFGKFPEWSESRVERDKRGQRTLPSLSELRPKIKGFLPHMVLSVRIQKQGRTMKI